MGAGGVGATFSTLGGGMGTLLVNGVEDKGGEGFLGAGADLLTVTAGLGMLDGGAGAAVFPRFQTLVTTDFAAEKNPKREGLAFGAAAET